ncbi:hypothetical protein D9M68_559500 [compost metagenome]
MVHEETPAEAGRTIHSLQIFVALPPDRQDSTPFALSLEPDEIPVVVRPGVRLRVVAGTFGQTVSPLKPPTSVTLLDISLEEGAELDVPLLAGHCAVVMPIHSVVTVNGHACDREDLRVPLLQPDGRESAIQLQALHGASEVMIFAGAPFHPTTL